LDNVRVIRPKIPPEEWMHLLSVDTQKKGCEFYLAALSN
jgi:hypothetical protein